MSEIQNIALRHLTLSPLNVRTVRTKEAVESLAANILTHGIIQNLRVHTQDEGYGVVVGGTRLAALQLLLKQKKITEDYQVPCEVRPANDPTLTEVSLSENVARQAMHPVDEFEAYKKLADDNHGPEEIAARMGTTARHVLQRLKLARVNPKLIALVRKGEMNMDQLEAFTVSDDQKKQWSVWQELPDWAKHRAEGDPIRKALTEQHSETDSKLVKFIGVEAYENHGGAIIRDLFDTDPDAGWLADTALLNRLVTEKMEVAAETVRGEGWKWLEIMPEQAENFYDYARLTPGYADPTPEAQAEIRKIEIEGAAIHKKHGDEPEDEDAYNRLVELQERLDELSEGEAIWKPEQKAVAGIMLTVSHEGELDIRRGMVKPEDKAALRKLTKGDGPSPTGKPAKAKGGLPASLVTELTAHKTKAAQLVLSGNPAVALRAVTHALAIRLFYDGYTDEHTSLGIEAHEPTFPLAIREQIEKSATGKKMDAVEKAWRKKLPKEPEQLWAWIEKQPKATVESLLAVCAAMSLDLVQVNGAEAKASAAALTSAIKLDMADHFTTTAENYFTRVSKKTLIAELGTAVSATTKRSLESMKRDQLAKTLTTELRGKKWLPPILRAGKPGVA